MNICCSCYGTGRVTCFSCGGQRRHPRFATLGDLDVCTCLICRGSGVVRCRICGRRHDLSGYVNGSSFHVLIYRMPDGLIPRS